MAEKEIAGIIEKTSAIKEKIEQSLGLQLII